MKKVIDAFDSTAGWTLSAGVTSTLNQHPVYIADNNTASLQVAIPAGGGSITKDLSGAPIDVSGYDELTFHFITFENALIQLITNGTFYYTLEIGDGEVYSIPVEKGFCPVTIYIGDLAAITEITISSTAPTADTLIISGMVASFDELPLDIFTSVKDSLQTYLDSKLSFSMGTVAAATAGDTSVTVATPMWLDANCVVKISSGGNTEYHHVKDYVDGVLTFSTLYDGAALLYNHVAATVSFYIPVNYGMDQEIILPGVTLWEDDEQVTEPRNKENPIYDTRTETHFKVRKGVRYTNYTILIDLEAWQVQVMKEAKQYIRNWLEREDLWVNGKLFHFKAGEAVSINLTSRVEGIDIVPKTQYTFNIQIGVNIWDRESISKTELISLTTSIRTL